MPPTPGNQALALIKPQTVYGHTDHQNMLSHLLPQVSRQPRAVVMQNNCLVVHGITKVSRYTHFTMGSQVAVSGINVLFTAPNRLLGLCRLTCLTRVQKPVCSKLVRCGHHAVYKISLSCGSDYTGQTSRYLNVHLRVQE